MTLASLAAPVDHWTEVWAAGVTYRRSREARREESRAPDVYEMVYDAPRPELFFKSLGWRVRGHGQTIAVRPDSSWDVPEPELAVVVCANGEMAGYTICDDVSSRSIEGENPLYLPQAKVYLGGTALGPGIRTSANWRRASATLISPESMHVMVRGHTFMYVDVPLICAAPVQLPPL
ncbi:hypothetical protein AB0B53_04565, partial [Microbispora bryophytorum]